MTSLALAAALPSLASARAWRSSCQPATATEHIVQNAVLPAKEILAGQPAATVVAIDDPTIAGELQRIFTNTGRLRVYTNPDVVGCEVAGALKNVIAIATGACDALEIPVVGGNVSLYNETDGKAIYPTPTIGIVGLLAHVDHVLTRRFRQSGDIIILLGTGGVVLAVALAGGAGAGASKAWA